MRPSTKLNGLRAIESRVVELARRLRPGLIGTISQLVRTPSENIPPRGNELDCQKLVYETLRDLGCAAELYGLDTVEGLKEHPAFRPGRDYTNRPNTHAVCHGSGGGRSLLLSGHIDTVPRGSEPWIRDPFGPQIEGNRLYGLGANDMKGGVGIILTAVKALREAGVTLRGDLMVETVVDEEFGGVNGTIAGRIRNPKPDAAILCEPSQNMICPAQTGGRTVHLRFRASPGGILSADRSARAPAQLTYLFREVEKFAKKRRATAVIHPLYRYCADPVPVWITKISAGGWGPAEPQTVPPSCRLELYWQAMPGESKQDIDREFHDWLDRAVVARPDLFEEKPEVSFPFEWLPGSAIEPDHEFVTSLSAAYHAAAGELPQVGGIGGPCDMYVLHQHFATPAVLFGPRGGNTHAPDEWVDLESAQLTLETLLRFICQWCEIDLDRTVGS